MTETFTPSQRRMMMIGLSLSLLFVIAIPIFEAVLEWRQKTTVRGRDEASLSATAFGRTEPLDGMTEISREFHPAFYSIGPGRQCATLERLFVVDDIARFHRAFYTAAIEAGYRIDLVAPTSFADIPAQERIDLRHGSWSGPPVYGEGTSVELMFFNRESTQLRLWNVSAPTNAIFGLVHVADLDVARGGGCS